MLASFNFAGVRAGATMEKHLATVLYRESYFGTTFLCHGEKA